MKNVFFFSPSKKEQYGDPEFEETLQQSKYIDILMIMRVNLVILARICVLCKKLGNKIQTLMQMVITF